MSVDLETLKARHRRILGGLGLIDRPWFILGGAPDPRLPSELVASHARVDINNVGKTAAALGLGQAALTVRRTRERWDVHPDLDTRGLLWFTHHHPVRLHLKLWTQRRARVEKLIRMPKEERNAIVEAVAGREIRQVGDLGKPSNGIAALCYGLFVGVPEIVLVGMSLTRQGHSFDTLQRPRKQIIEDRFVLEKLAGETRVATSEADLATETGLRLWRGGPST